MSICLFVSCRHVAETCFFACYVLSRMLVVTWDVPVIVVACHRNLLVVVVLPRFQMSKVAGQVMTSQPHKHVPNYRHWSITHTHCKNLHSRRCTSISSFWNWWTIIPFDPHPSYMRTGRSAPGDCGGKMYVLFPDLFSFFNFITEQISAEMLSIVCGFCYKNIAFASFMQFQFYLCVR